MKEEFEITLEYKGKEHHFTAYLIKYGYSYRIVVEVNGNEIIFEPDEERNFRARIETGSEDAKHHIDQQLIKQIGEFLQENLK